MKNYVKIMALALVFGMGSSGLHAEENSFNQRPMIVGAIALGLGYFGLAQILEDINKPKNWFLGTLFLGGASACGYLGSSGIANYSDTLLTGVASLASGKKTEQILQNHKIAAGLAISAISAGIVKIIVLCKPTVSRWWARSRLEAECGRLIQGMKSALAFIEKLKSEKPKENENEKEKNEKNLISDEKKVDKKESELTLPDDSYLFGCYEEGIRERFEKDVEIKNFGQTITQLNIYLKWAVGESGARKIADDMGENSLFTSAEISTKIGEANLTIQAVKKHLKPKKIEKNEKKNKKKKKN